MKRITLMIENYITVYKAIMFPGRITSVDVNIQAHEERLGVNLASYDLSIHRQGLSPFPVERNRK